MKIKINNNERTSAEKTYKIQNNNQLIIKRPVLIISENDINELLNIVNIIPIMSLKQGTDLSFPDYFGRCHKRG